MLFSNRKVLINAKQRNLEIITVGVTTMLLILEVVHLILKYGV